MEVCEYKKNSVEPCKDCPRLMSALYRCGFLQEELKQLEALAKNKKIDSKND